MKRLFALLAALSATETKVTDCSRGGDQASGAREKSSKFSSSKTSKHKLHAARSKMYFFSTVRWLKVEIDSFECSTECSSFKDKSKDYRSAVYQVNPSAESGP